MYPTHLRLLPVFCRTFPLCLSCPLLPSTYTPHTSFIQPPNPTPRRPTRGSYVSFAYTLDGEATQHTAEHQPRDDRRGREDTTMTFVHCARLDAAMLLFSHLLVPYLQNRCKQCVMKCGGRSTCACWGSKPVSVPPHSCLECCSCAASAKICGGYNGRNRCAQKDSSKGMRDVAYIQRCTSFPTERELAATEAVGR